MISISDVRKCIKCKKDEAIAIARTKDPFCRYVLIALGSLCGSYVDTEVLDEWVGSDFHVRPQQGNLIFLGSI